MKRSLKGASLVEALVASVIFLTVFLIAMNSLTDIARVRFSGTSPAVVEEAVGGCLAKFAAETADRAVYSYPWGDIEIVAEPYRASDDLLDVVVTAKVKNQNTVIYRYLICRNSIQQ